VFCRLGFALSGTIYKVKQSREYAPLVVHEKANKEYFRRKSKSFEHKKKVEKNSQQSHEGRR
jgi:hypothetical protein